MIFRKLKFSAMPALRPLIGRETGREAMLMDPLIVTWVTEDGKSRRLRVPPGFTMSGVATPTRLRGITPYTNRQFRPSVVHDWICVYMLIDDICLVDPTYLFTWSEATDFFNAMLEAEGVSCLHRTIMVGAVKTHGWFK